MGGLASLPLVGKYFKLAEPLSKAAPVATESVKLGFDKFMVLVNKIKTLGDDVTPQRSTIERGQIFTISTPYPLKESRSFPKRSSTTLLV